MANTKITNPELFNLGDSTSATQLPVMTTTQRIAMVPTTPASSFNIDYLVVAGGGAGSTGNGYTSGGGGAGGLLTNVEGSSLVLDTSNTYNITVGDGGDVLSSSGSIGANGSNSILSGTGITTLTAIGGGRGGAVTSSFDGATGGSGGGGASATTVGSGGAAVQSGAQGNNGGNGISTDGRAAGGGGGAGSAGVNASGSGTNWVAGNGGNGLTNSITVASGTGPYYAGGGGGGAYYYSGWSFTPGTGGSGVGGNGSQSSNAAGNGATNTGSGGGGSDRGAGGSGGSGIVILRYPTAEVASYTATGLTPTETTVGTDTVLSFTTVGTGTINFTGATITGTPPMTDGEMIFNSTTDKVEYWDGTKWYGITSKAPGESPYNNVLYTGSGDTTNGQSITGIGFKPDLLWFKSTGTTYYNVLYDSIRGTNAAISSNLTNSTYSNYNRLQSFDNDGFTIKANNTADLWKIDRSGQPFVAWCFKAGGAAVANTDGSVASQVSANVTGGFSIVEYTGVASGTVGHGLNVPPELIITKQPGSTSYWQTYAAPLGKDKLLQLNTTGGAISISNYWGTNPPTATVFGLSTNSGHNPAFGLNIAYCFASVPGYSKIGSYTGNGSTNGPTVPLGFQPAFLMCKETSSTGNWRMMDSTRQPSNPKSNGLWANLTNAESASSSNKVDFNSDNFQLVGGGSDVNASGQTYMYLAFA